MSSWTSSDDLHYSLLFLGEAADLFFGAFEGGWCFLLEFSQVFLVLCKSWDDHGVVHGSGAESWWVEQVHQETQFQEVVEWNEGQDNTGKLIDNVEGTEAHPVCEPLLVVLKAFGFQGQEAHEGWVSNTDEICDIGGADAEHDGHNSSDQSVLHEGLDWCTSGLRDLLKNLHCFEYSLFNLYKKVNQLCDFISNEHTFDYILS